MLRQANLPPPLMDPVQPAQVEGTAFELVALGPPSLRDRAGLIPVGLGSGKPLALLCFLVLRGEVRRDEALALLWGDVEEDRARNAFRQALHRLRLALGDDVVVADRQFLRMSATHALRADVLEFEKAFDENRLDAAVALYRGDFLEGFDAGTRAFDEWADGERLRLRARAASAAERAAQRALADGRMDDAQAAVRRLLAVAANDPRAIEAAASAFVSMGQRAQAAETLGTFIRRSREEGLDVPRSLQSMLDRLSPAANRPEVGDRKDSSLIGRGTELARLLAIWETVGKEAGATVVLEGPAGIGKSRVLREFHDGVRALGVVHLLHGVEGPRGFTAPYAAVATALRPLVRAAGVAGASPHLLAEAARLLPELRDAFQLPQVEPVQEDTARLRICEGIASLIEAAAYERRICLTLEDVHRASSSTLELLGYLAARLRHAPVAVILSFNPDDLSHETAARVRALAGGPGRDGHGTSAESHVLSLAPLSLGDTTDLVVQMLGPSTPLEKASLLAERSEGNPLRVIELARLALDGIEPTSLPMRIHDLVLERIRASSVNERRMLLAAAILARPASLQLLADAAHLAAPAAQDAALGLARRGLLTETGSAFVVSSDATARASLELAGEATAVFVAGWVAEMLTRDPGADAGEVARLFALAGRVPDAYRWAREAGERALGRGATEEALYFLKGAREFARPGAEQAAIESLLVAHGAGRSRLPGAAPSGGHTSVADTKFIQRHFPHWRYLVGGALATLIIAIIQTVWGPVQPITALASTDTLIVARAIEARSGFMRLVSPTTARGFVVSEPMPRGASKPSWVDSTVAPWVNAIPSPTGRFVALERVTPTGSNLYLVAADRRDTIPLATGEDAYGMGWSPDGAWFLATRRRGAGDAYRMGLFAFPVLRPAEPIAIDTASNHSVSEASWSPDGAHIAWVARVAGAQEEVFAAWADGTHRRNLSAHPAQDDHLAWSGDGSLLAFTSRRDGNAELYAYDLINERLWRLTENGAQDDRARFDAEGRFVAFESTRGGAPGVYIMPSLGGEALRVGDSTSTYEVVGWRRPTPGYVDGLQLGALEEAPPQPADTVVLRVRGVDQRGATVLPWLAQWTVIDASQLQMLPLESGASPLERSFVALRHGLARVAVTVGGWRTDTAYVRIGDAPVSLMQDEFSGGRLATSWRLLGQPLPALGSVPGDNGALLMRSDRQWESGVLSSAPVPIRPGLVVEATLHASFQMHAAATTASLALVAPDPPEAIDTIAPQFLRLIAITWNADERRFIYSAERDVFVESVPAGTVGDARVLRIVVNADGTVSFLVDGKQRWRSTLRVLRAAQARSALVWLGGQDTGADAAFGRISVSLQTAR
jgi:DNA-binding SARP family transcriptional activator